MTSSLSANLDEPSNGNELKAGLERVYSLEKTSPVDFLRFQTLKCNFKLPEEISHCVNSNKEETKMIRIPYALRRVPTNTYSTILATPTNPRQGDIALAQLTKIGKNTRFELVSGRACTLHEGDLLAVVFGNRYATMQFEGYAATNGENCDLLSMGGLCGMVESKHTSVADASKLRLIGALGDAKGHPLNLRNFALHQLHTSSGAGIVVVCGTSMDAGKTHTAMSLITGLRKDLSHVAGIKLTGTAAGKDTWNMLDAGACSALDFIDGGFPSTYLSTVDELLNLHKLLVSHAVSNKAEFIIVEIADGLLQKETAALLQTPEFVNNIDAWVFASGDPLAAAAGVDILRQWGIEPLSIAGKVSMSPLGIKETQAVTGLDCLTAAELQSGKLNERIIKSKMVSRQSVSRKGSVETCYEIWTRLSMDSFTA